MKHRCRILYWVLPLLIGVLTLCTYPSARASSQSSCGTWDAHSNSSDTRIKVIPISQGSGDACQGAFRFENKTGITLVGGGYTLELHVLSDTTKTLWVGLKDLPNNGNTLLPSFDIELHAFPNNVSSKSSVVVNGDITLNTWALDASIFLVKTGLEFSPISGDNSCLHIPAEQIVLVALRLTGIVGTAAGLALRGDVPGAVDELKQVANEFYSRAVDALRDIGLDCAANGLKAIIGKPAIILKVAFAYLTWVPLAIADYIKYEGSSNIISLTYSPATANEATIDGLGSVEGQIRWSNQPLTDITIELIKNGCARRVTIMQTVTDSLGNYRFENVEPGKYVLELNGLDYPDNHKPLFQATCGPSFLVSDNERHREDRDILKTDLVVLNPAQSAISGSNPTFSWEPYPVATYYRVSLFRRSPSFQQIFLHEKTDHTSLLSPTTLEVDAQYDG